jgi:2-polyprenyl-3-methyl-5-hydroxy-6-metoxy-1,4-benzoquinol methylase
MSDLDPIRDGRHYDALKAQNDIAFYLAQAQAASGPVLEIGTGRVTIPLAAAGVDITGLDVSASMLEEAKRKAES